MFPFPLNSASPLAILTPDTMVVATCTIRSVCCLGQAVTSDDKELLYIKQCEHSTL
jgi:hypothetical protein